MRKDSGDVKGILESIKLKKDPSKDPDPKHDTQDPKINIDMDIDNNKKYRKNYMLSYGVIKKLQDLKFNHYPLNTDFSQIVSEAIEKLHKEKTGKGH